MPVEQVLVVAVDLGTTAFTIAYQLARRATNAKGVTTNTAMGSIDVVSRYPNQVERGVSSVPTDMYYNKEGVLKSWGHTALDEEESDDFDPNRSVHNWKLSLHQSTDPTHQETRAHLMEVAEKFGKNPKGFLSDFLHDLYSFLFISNGARFKAYCGNTLGKSKIEVVIATPPGWAPSELLEIRDAAEQLGLSSSQIFLVSETECLFRQWVNEYKLKGQEMPLKVMDTILVVDAGGGTTCIVLFKRIEDGMIQVLPSKSLNAGSEIVTEEFLKLLRLRLDGIRGLEELDQICRRARKLFDTRKKKLDGPAGSRVLEIPVPGLREGHPEWAGNGVAFFTPSVQLKNCFNPSLRLIRNEINELLRKVAVADKPKLVLLGGAYGSSSHLLRGAVLQALGGEIIEAPFDPEAGGESVARGAVLTRMQDTFIGKRSSKFSIGIVTWLEYSNVIKQYPSFRNIVPRARIDSSGKYWCLCCTWIIRRGEIVDNHQIFDVDKDKKRFYTFQKDEEIKFYDRIIISSQNPEDDITPLEFENFSGNITRARAKGGKYDWQVVIISWNLGLTKNPRNDGKPYPKSAIETVQENDTKIWLYKLEYQYKVSISDTETRFRMEAHFKDPYGIVAADVKQCPFERGDAVEESRFLVQQRVVMYGGIPKAVDMGERKLGAAIKDSPDSDDMRPNPIQKLEGRQSYSSESNSDEDYVEDVPNKKKTANPAQIAPRAERRLLRPRRTPRKSVAKETTDAS